MPTIEIIKAAGPYVIAITSFVAAVLVVYLNYRNQLKTRKEAYRQEIYKRIITACEEIYSFAVEIHEHFSAVPSELQGKVTTPEYNTKLIFIRQKHIMYLSPTIVDALNEFAKFYDQGKAKRLELLDRLADAIKEHLNIKTLLEGMPEIFNIKVCKDHKRHIQ